MPNAGRLVRSLFAAGLCLTPTWSLAQEPAPASPSLISIDTQIAAFKDSPATILQVSPIGGMQVSALAKAILLGDLSLIDKLIEEAKVGNRLQANSIGVGIGLAVKSLEASNKTAAQDIARKVAAANNGDLFTGYNAGVGDIGTFAVGGAGTGAGGGAGGGVGGVVGGGLSSSSGAHTTSATGSSYLTNAGAQTLSFSASFSCTKTVSPSSPC